ncbi:MAG: hypothetical protein JSS09_00995 [Verrucomicrobia bacterium]|nr:hypothetical protein [Verrucomicrobiota bacterium]
MITPQIVNQNFEKAVSIYKEEKKQKCLPVARFFIATGSVFMDNLRPHKQTFTGLDVKKQGDIELESEKIAGIFAISVLALTYITISSMPKKFNS